MSELSILSVGYTQLPHPMFSERRLRRGAHNFERFIQIMSLDQLYLPWLNYESISMISYQCSSLWYMYDITIKVSGPSFLLLIDQSCWKSGMLSASLWKNGMVPATRTIWISWGYRNFISCFYVYMWWSLCWDLSNKIIIHNQGSCKLMMRGQVNKATYLYT